MKMAPLFPRIQFLGSYWTFLVSYGSGYHSLPSVEFISYDDQGNRVSCQRKLRLLLLLRMALVTSDSIIERK